MRASATLFLLIWGCLGYEVGDVQRTDDTDVLVDPYTPDGRYDPRHLTEVSANLADPEWDALLLETRTFYELLLAPDCFTEPTPNAFSWHPGDVTVDGASLTQVGFRKKGLIGSLSWTRPSLKIDTDKFVDGQEFSDGKEHFTLNNNRQDPSRLHSCLAYGVFTAAGAIAPQCALATVEVNGADLGVYSNVEPLKKPFLRRAFDNDDGVLYEGTVSDFDDDFLATFEIKTDGGDLAALEELTAALDLPDDQLMARLDELLDVDGFVTYWVVEGIIGHWDGYSAAGNNFYVYDDIGATDRLRFVPWGADAVFEDPEMSPLFTTGRVAMRLWNHPEGRQRWRDEAQRILDDVWDEDALHAEIDRMHALIEPHLLDLPAARAETDVIHGFVDRRRAVVQGAIDSAPSRPMFDRTRQCLEPIGELSVTFDATWGDLSTDDPLAAPTTFTGSIDGEALDNYYSGTVAGFDEDGTRMVVVVGVDATVEWLNQLVVAFPLELAPGTYPVDIVGVPGYLVQGNLKTNDFALTGLVGGELVVDEVDYRDGGVIRGSVTGLVIPNFLE